MITETLEAWVLHKTLVGDTSLRVIFFTRGQGIISCFYRGGRNPKNQAVLQAFMPLWLVLNVRKGQYFVHHVEAQAGFLQIKGYSFFSALYVNELVFYAVKQQDPQPELFEAYQQTMQGLFDLTERLAIEILLRRFELLLLKICGYALPFSSGDPINPHFAYQFLPDQGFIEVATGLPGADLLALSEGRLDQLSVLKTAKCILRQAINHLLGGRELKSRSLFRSGSREFVALKGPLSKEPN